MEMIPAVIHVHTVIAYIVSRMLTLGDGLNGFSGWVIADMVTIKDQKTRWLVAATAAPASAPLPAR